MIRDWVRIDGMCYCTKNSNALTITNNDGHKVEIRGHITLIVHEADEGYSFLRGNRVEVMSEEAYPTLALAKINMLKYMRDNSL